MMLLEPETFGITLLLFSLACLGTWPALLRLCSFHQEDTTFSKVVPSSFEDAGCTACCTRCCSAFYPREQLRNICHVYLDYSTAYFLVSSLPLLVSVLLAHETIFTTTPFSLLVTAMLGGALLSCGNLSLQWATAVYGAPLTTVLSIQASMAVILGTSLNYLLEPSKTPKPHLLVAGVLVFLMAIIFATHAQIIYGKLKERRANTAGDYADIEMRYGSTTAANDARRSVVLEKEHSETDILAHHTTIWEQAPVEMDDPMSVSSNSARPLLGVYVATAGGLCFGFFSPAFNIAVNDPFDWGKHGSLSVARVNLWFSFSFWIASIVGNSVLLKQQFGGSTGSVLMSYMKQDGIFERQLALMAGLVCALGNVLQFQGGQMVGYATADLVQAYPLVSTMWDVFLFREFQSVRISNSLWFLLAGMYLAYLLGVLLLASSSME